VDYSWDFSVVWANRATLARGLWVSLELTAFCIVVGTMIAVPVALLLVRRAGPIQRLTTAVVEIIRALPILVLLIATYYLLPSVIGISLSAFWTSAWVLALNLAAFAADILRGGIRAIPHENLDAALAIGMDERLIRRRIIVPETFRRSIPALTGLYITMFKFSTLASVISVSELLHAGDSVIINSYKPLEVYTAIAVAYLIVILPASYVARRLERLPQFAVHPGRPL
jgi:polar amino acid transport system permease protein